MRTILIFHEVDDVEHWLASPRRHEIFGPVGITARPFVDPGHSHRVGLIVEVPSIELFEESIRSPAAVAAMKSDGVRPGTVRILTEGPPRSARRSAAPSSESRRSGTAPTPH